MTRIETKDYMITCRLVNTLAAWPESERKKAIEAYRAARGYNEAIEALFLLAGIVAEMDGREDPGEVS